MSPASPGGVGDDCDCTYDPDEWCPGDVIPAECVEVPFQYKRTCQMCGRVVWSGHCPHDEIQRRCRECGWLPEGGRTPMQALGIETRPTEGTLLAAWRYH